MDKELSRVADVRNNVSRVVADISYLPFNFNELDPKRKKQIVAFIATPNHLEAINTLVKSGVRKLIVEKPMVNNGTEIDELQKLLNMHPDLKIYPLDFYLQKATPLLALMGQLPNGDPRWNRLETGDGEEVDGKRLGVLQEHIGNIEGIEMSLIEGGSFGLPDLAKRPWLEFDKKRGGMLLDLGTHALVPLIASGILAIDKIDINFAHRYILGQNRQSFIRAGSEDAEIFAQALLSLQIDDHKIPLSLTIGKTFHDGGIWKLVVRGSQGDLSFGLRTGQPLTIESNKGRPMTLRLKPADAYALAFQDAHRYFEGDLPASVVLQPMIDSIRILDRIKEVSNKS